MLATFFSELEGLAKYAEFTVIPFDTEVQEAEVFVWKKGKRRSWERVSCGGTDFNAPTHWVNERKFDGHIILTDMEAPKPVRSKLGLKRMWMTTPECKDRQYFPARCRRNGYCNRLGVIPLVPTYPYVRTHLWSDLCQPTSTITILVTGDKTVTMPLRCKIVYPFAIHRRMKQGGEGRNGLLTMPRILGDMWQPIYLLVTA